jgi:hypothetical protein
MLSVVRGMAVAVSRFSIAPMVVGSWAVAAFLVTMVEHTFASDPALCGAAKVAVIIITAFAYMTLGVRRATLDHALAVGVVWLVLGVIVEVATSAHIHHAWFELLGSPAHPVIRNVLLVAWVAAPALFARYRP